MVDRFQALSLWRDMRENHENLKRHVLELLRHPDATPENIMAVREAYIKSHAHMVNAQNKLLDKYGNHGAWRVVRFNEGEMK